MIESINFRTEIGSSLLQTTQATLANLPRRLNAPSRNQTPNNSKTLASLPRSIERNRQRWTSDANILKLDRAPQTVTPNLNPRQQPLTGNHRLARLVTTTIGDRWMTHLEDLQQLTPLAGDPLFQLQWQAVKQTNKQAFANALQRLHGIKINVNSLFDLQLQPICGHQRQLLNILHIIDLFDRLKQNPSSDILPRTFIFGDASAPQPLEIDSVADANDALVDEIERRETIALIESLSRVLAADPDVCNKLQVVYVPASAALTNQMFAAADVTQQIATAKIEDIDLGKLKAAINGVISIGSLGKTNTWLQQLVGEENCFRFGLAIPEITLFKEYGYDPYNYYKHYPQIRQAIDWLLSGHFAPAVPGLCKSIVDKLMGTDEHMVLADYIFYLACQSLVSETYRHPATWTHMSIMNVAGVK
ncbi:glycogen/starch/alpha-glucan phosphorylase [Chamaesiphon minutus]|uniref:glycogen/starch/alpha-glucan phosphorylase n=1 Tax=Chamaesiphon minutus TaxID=1173032 RepID=UPI0006850454|nr:glycogen/starch/alpha-glucan phosphorylase [Chamaesiphon minutus]